MDHNLASKLISQPFTPGCNPVSPEWSSATIDLLHHFFSFKVKGKKPNNFIRSHDSTLWCIPACLQPSSVLPISHRQRRRSHHSSAELRLCAMAPCTWPSAALCCTTQQWQHVFQDRKKHTAHLSFHHKQHFYFSLYLVIFFFIRKKVSTFSFSTKWQFVQ